MISFIIPAKNEEKFINNCIGNIIKAIDRWGKSSEIILVDNGSTDKTAEIALTMGAKVIKVKDGTIAHLRNVGAENASGKYLAFIDADCLIPIEWVEYCISTIDNPKVAGVGTRAIPDYRNSTWVERSVASLMADAERPDYVKWLGTSNLLIKKNIFISFGGFDENLITGEDVHLCKKINKNFLFFLEKRIFTIHLRESKTLYDLFKREFWRGSHSIIVFKKSNYDMSELPSIILPFVNYLLLLLSILFIFTFNSSYIIYFIFYLLIPVVLIFKKRKKLEFSAFFQYYIVAFIYLTSRSCAQIFEIKRLIKHS